MQPRHGPAGPPWCLGLLPSATCPVGCSLPRECAQEQQSEQALRQSGGPRIESGAGARGKGAVRHRSQFGWTETDDWQVSRTCTVPDSLLRGGPERDCRPRSGLRRTRKHPGNRPVSIADGQRSSPGPGRALAVPGRGRRPKSRRGPDYKSASSSPGRRSSTTPTRRPSTGRRVATFGATQCPTGGLPKPAPFVGIASNSYGGGSAPHGRKPFRTFPVVSG